MSLQLRLHGTGGGYEAGWIMSALARLVFLGVWAAVGVWGAIRLLESYSSQNAFNQGLDFANGGVFVLIPVAIVGALVGALLGGFLLPKHR